MYLTVWLTLAPVYSLWIRGAFRSGFHTPGPLIQDYEKGIVRFLDVTTTAKNPMRFEECYFPLVDEQRGRQSCSRIWLLPPCCLTVVGSNTAAPPVIRTSLNGSTLLELPAKEKVATVFGDNTNDWIFNAGHIARRFISVKPKASAAESKTNVHIISGRGNDYTIELEEVSGDATPMLAGRPGSTASLKTVGNRLCCAP